MYIVQIGKRQRSNREDVANKSENTTTFFQAETREMSFALPGTPNPSFLAGSACSNVPKMTDPFKLAGEDGKPGIGAGGGGGIATSVPSVGRGAAEVGSI